MFARNNKVVEEGEDEVEDEAPPDGDVVEHCPVGGVQCHLNSNYEGGATVLDWNDVSLPSHCWTNGRQPSKTIITNG